MPTTSRYVLNDLQQATLDVMAANVMPGDDEDLTRATMTRHEIISAVQQVPGQDEVNGNHMGPTLHCLKRRGLVAEASWPAKGKFHITPMGITYVDLDGEPEAEVPRGEFAMEEVDKAVEEIEAEQQAPEAPSRDDLLTKLAMELEEWPKTTRDVPSGINAMWCFDRGSCPEESGVYAWATHNPGPDDDTINEYDWLARRAELINKPAWRDAPEWAQWLAQDESGLWHWFESKPSAHDRQWDEIEHEDKIKRSEFGAIPASHDWRETLEARPATQASSAGASSTACDDQHRPEPAAQAAEVEADLLATRDAIVGMEQALEELDDSRSSVCGDCGKDLTAEEVTYYGYQCEACVWADHKAMQMDMEDGAASEAQPAPAILARFDELAELNASYQAAHAAPASRAPEVTILSVAVHPPGTAWLDNDATVLIKLMDEGGGPYLDISSWDGPAAIESLEMLEAVTNTARNLLREAEAREVAQWPPRP